MLTTPPSGVEPWLCPPVSDMDALFKDEVAAETDTGPAAPCDTPELIDKDPLSCAVAPERSATTPEAPPTPSIDPTVTEPLESLLL